MTTLIIIPARMESERLPGKPLRKLKGKTLLERVYEKAKKTKAEHVVVTSPDREIIKFCQDKGIVSWPSEESHPTGTHRCSETLAWVRRKRPDITKVINWQVDEPCVEPASVDELIDSLDGNQIATIVTEEEWLGYSEDTNTVKAACEGGVAFWFSRYLQEGSRVHVGIYGFQVNVLAELGALPPSELSKAESLEQLAWIQYGGPIGYIEIDYLPISVNTERDLIYLEGILDA